MICPQSGVHRIVHAVVAVLLVFRVCDAASQSAGLPAGDVKGYYSFQQISAIMTYFHNRYPQWASAPEVIGESFEGRSIYAQRIGAEGCSFHASGGLLLTGLQHAREPLGMMVTLRFASEILQELALGNRTMLTHMSKACLHIIPCVNPDAYVFNLVNMNSNNRMARKNRRPGCSSGSYQDVGVDLNRNYDFYWNYDEQGSSSQSCSDMYRGSAPFSEPETVAVSRYVLQYKGQLTVALNYHSFGRYINLPYALQTKGSPPEAIYTNYLALAQRMSAGVPFQYGHPWTGGLYTCNGEASDWMLETAQIYAMSPELGPNMQDAFDTGMWPTENDLPALIDEGLQLTRPAFYMSTSQLVVTRIENPTMGSCGSQCVTGSLTVEVFNDAVVATRGTVSLSLVPNLQYLRAAWACSIPGATRSTQSPFCKVSFQQLGLFGRDASQGDHLTGCPTVALDAPFRRTQTTPVLYSQIPPQAAEQARAAKKLLNNYTVRSTYRKLNLADVLDPASRIAAEETATAASEITMIGGVPVTTVTMPSMPGLVTARLALELAHAEDTGESLPACTVASTQVTSLLVLADDAVCVVYTINCQGLLVKVAESPTGCLPCILFRPDAWNMSGNTANHTSFPETAQSVESIPWPWTDKSSIAIQAGVLAVGLAVVVASVVIGRILWKQRQARGAVSFTPVPTEDPSHDISSAAVGVDVAGAPVAHHGNESLAVSVNT
jgi:hypothetical protein